MNLQSGLKRIYVVLAALWGVFWLVVFFHEVDMPPDGEDLIFFGVPILASPLVYFALVGLTKMVTWVVAGFKAEQPH